jgi:ABC-type Fe3+/spermidine/putrescine transport system ATPase subunit
MAVRIECSQVVKRFGGVTVLDHLDWTVEPGSVVGLLGGSGAGKTTLLRVIAGLERCTAGRVELRPSEPGQRKSEPSVGMVFQNLALWPHLTARQHLECVMRRTPRPERRCRAEELLAETRLPRAAWDRRPAELSGGEAQRLALARALAHEPQVLLLDEPLAQVDTVLRAELLELIDGCIQGRPMTTLYVTHAWREALQIGRRIAVLRGGRIALEGTPDEAYWDLSDAELARLTGPVTELPRDWLAQGLIACRDEGVRRASDRGQQSSVLVVRPQQLCLVEPEGRNRWTPIDCQPEGTGWVVTLAGEDRRLSVPSSRPPRTSGTVGVELLSLARPMSGGRPPGAPIPGKRDSEAAH